MKDNKDGKRYEEKIKELEKIVDALEKGDIDLEESMELYLKGIEIYKESYQYLNKAKGEVKAIMEDRIEDFDIEFLEE